MTANQARQWTLKELIEWCDKQMEDCESKEDNWVVIGNTSGHRFKKEQEVIRGEKTGDTDYRCTSKNKRDWWFVEEKDLENRKHLDTTRYQAFKDMKDKCNELMNSISVAA